MKSFEYIKLKNKLLEKITKSFFINDIKYIYGYGSGVIPQKNHVASMIDVFFIVDDLKKFHISNIKKNHEHYSGLAKICGVDNLVKVNKYGTSVFYNPGIEIGNDLFIKYGVIHIDDFNYHNTNWDNLFVPGRFHKPVLSIKSDKQIESTMNLNREAAVNNI